MASETNPDSDQQSTIDVDAASTGINWKKVRDNFWRYFGVLPLIGPLADCTLDAHKRSIKEFIPSIAFATATFWLSAIFLFALKLNHDARLADVLVSTVDAGELLTFSLAFLGTIIVSAAEDPEGSERRFPGRAWHFFFVFLIAVVASGFYSMHRVMKAGAFDDAFDSGYVLKASLFIAILSILIAYLTLVYKNQTFNPDREIKDKEADFVKAFEESLKQ